MTVTATPSPVSEHAADQGSTLKLGQSRVADDAISTGSVAVLRFRQPLRAAFPPDRDGYEYAGVEVKRCFKTLERDDITVGWAVWSLAYANGNITEPPSSWSADHFTVALYPRDRPVTAGKCVRGWIPFEVRKGTRPATVAYMISGSDPMEWTIR
ncbi:hypothetical protein ACIBH1_05455 [Nonomuraea sp. NPDC050663]|uniref:hypothetical protein n=1 Tax=Nonomuraea sp. NPDC050663 TaxID=3364370 RepID=UPI0037917B48